MPCSYFFFAEFFIRTFRAFLRFFVGQCRGIWLARQTPNATWRVCAARAWGLGQAGLGWAEPRAPRAGAGPTRCARRRGCLLARDSFPYAPPPPPLSPLHPSPGPPARHPACARAPIAGLPAAAMQRLRCVAQNYAWGRRAAEGSAVARLAAAQAGEAADGAAPYAELWMGAHPSGMSTVADGGVPLAEWIESFPGGAAAALGEAVAKRWGGKLPMLFKVLSVAKALSIQSHPDKALAERLHAERPNVYKDDNHKPEMTLAVEPFEALCGFVAHEELRAALAATPEFAEVVGAENAAAAAAAAGDADAETAALKACFAAAMTAVDDVRVRTIRALRARLAAAPEGSLSPKERLFLRLYEQYPDDIGTMAVFFLNFVTLETGEGLYLGANEPHAYLSGQCVECMATSDNVVRAGLTPKLRDTDVLCSSLTYRTGAPHVLRGEAVDACKRLYAVPAPTDEFEVAAVTVAPGGTYDLAPNAGPQLVLAFGGSGIAAPVGGEPLAVGEGTVFFVPAGVAVGLTAAAGDAALVLYTCAVSSRVFE